MVSADDIAECEAFLPPASDEEYWPPATREIAKEWAREARLRERGLAVDDATLERVADVIMDPAYEDVGLFYTAEELDDELPIGLYDVVQEYLDDRPAINGGVDFGWRDGRQVLFVGLVGDLEAHRAPLARMGGDRVVLEPRPRTVAELEAIEERIRDDEQELAAAGLELEPPLWCLPDRGVMQVMVVGGPHRRAAAGFFAARYGAAVEVVWWARHGFARFRTRSPGGRRRAGGSVCSSVSITTASSAATLV